MAERLLRSHAPIILASTSATRRSLCESVGLPVTCIAPSTDEDALKASLPPMPPADLARSLAEAKALSISTLQPDAYVIGADQICALGSEIFGKSGHAEKALAQLMRLQGQTHYQHSGYAIAHGGAILLSGTSDTRLRMHAWSEEELLRYIAAEQPFSSAGSYKFESLGRLLFAEVNGTTDMILGLPLSPVLSYFHQRGIIAF